MRRVAFVPLFLATSVLVAQEPPKVEDPVAAQLLKDKEAVAVVMDKAKDEMLKAFDRAYESVKNNKSLKIDVQIAQLKKIEADKKAFDESGTLPTLTSMKGAISEYRTAHKKAEAVCKTAFEKAARAYRDKGDLTAASQTLEEMKEFLAMVSSGGGSGGGGGNAIVIGCGLSNKVLGLSGGLTADGTKLMTADYVKGDQTQLWKVVPAADGWSYVENAKSGTVMTANGAGNGTEVTIAKKQTPPSDNQLWKVVASPAAKGAQRLYAKPSGKYIGVDAKSKEAGARILLWADQPTEAAQFFWINPPK